MDSGNDSVGNLRVLRAQDTAADFIIKRNLGKESPEAWLAIAQESGMLSEPRPGKQV